MVRTRSGAGIEVPRRAVNVVMADAAPEEQVPLEEEALGAEGLPPVPEEDVIQLTMRHANAIGQIREIIAQYGAKVPILEDEDTPCDILRLAWAVESLSTLEVAHTVQLTNRVETLNIQLATLSGALGLTLDELGDLPAPEVHRSVAANVEQVLRERLVEAVQTMPQNRRQSLNSALGSRGNGNGGSAVIPAGRTTTFPRKVRTDWACKLRPGMPPREAKTYLNDVREYLTLPQHVEYKNDMPFIRMIATSSMSAEALMMFRAAADPQQTDPETLITGFGRFSARVLSTFVYVVPSHLLRDDYERCVHRAGESLDDFYTCFSATVMDMDYKPSEQEQSSQFLRSSNLNVALKQCLESDVALEFYPMLVDTY